MNYSFLIQKYMPEAKFVMHDRSYDGIEWISPGKKPDKDVFDGWTNEELRLQKIDEIKDLADMKLIEEARGIAVAQAAVEAMVLEDRIQEEHEKIRADIFPKIKEAKEIAETKKTADALEECWREVNALQHCINEEAKDYLAETDYFVTRALETGERIPTDVMTKRAESKRRIQNGIVVFANWKILRAAEKPSREEIRKAIKSGGAALAQLKSYVKGISLKYPKTKIKE